MHHEQGLLRQTLRRVVPRRGQAQQVRRRHLRRQVLQARLPQDLPHQGAPRRHRHLPHHGLHHLRHSAILADSGGPCRPDPSDPAAMDRCLAGLKSDYVVATAAVAMVGSLAMGCLANLPLALAPAMGSNAYFAYNMVGFRGSGPLRYETALAAVMLEGCLFLLVSALGRGPGWHGPSPGPYASPPPPASACSSPSRGCSPTWGSASSAPAAPRSSSSPPALRPTRHGRVPRRHAAQPHVLARSGRVRRHRHLPQEGGQGKHDLWHSLRNPNLLVQEPSVTAFPSTPAGDSSYRYFRKVVDFHLISSTAGKISFNGFFTTKVWVPLVTLLYVDILSTTGSMYSMAELGGFTDDAAGSRGVPRVPRGRRDHDRLLLARDDDGRRVPRVDRGAQGGREDGGDGGRGGLPLPAVALLRAAAHERAAVGGGPVAGVVGAMMMAVAKEVEWGDTGEAVPAFVTMVVMPLTYSISNGIVAGVGCTSR
ncbi:uncharacterized protein M6B38_379015 [Iris pallida]|uniref:Uncharacterized protein n=1 Tax=Iris pallida TaxID=29817 RepID=A0AAX6G930_IRIPA|nr:uncharacterized protein M6B38_379015 [Iris pallida]